MRPICNAEQRIPKWDKVFWLLLAFACMLLLLCPAVMGQQKPPETGETADSPPTIVPHLTSNRVWVSAQDNIIFQSHPSFPATYNGVNSLHSHGENATSNIGTLYLGWAATRTTELQLDIESAAGGGISDALGLAGFTNVDVVRNPQLGVSPYIARGLVRQIIPLSSETVEVDRGPLALAERVPVRRIEVRAGKFGLNDFFDVNPVGGDSHLQFMNWTVVDNGAYDYAADTRGYTVGAYTEYDDHSWSFRFAEALMPTVANGIQYQWKLGRARAENYELELHPQVFQRQGTAIRLLGFENHANMGVYRNAIADFLAHKTTRPDITAHPPRTTVKYGFGVNLEQDLPHNLRAFARWGWNEGQHESFVYTEVDQTVALGGDLAGGAWHRKLDKAGVAFVSNGISAWHQKYLALGGRGFLLGDGGLNYGREIVAESYYNAHLWRGVYGGMDIQHVSHPGYNRDRGPVLVPGLRLHLDF